MSTRDAKRVLLAHVQVYLEQTSGMYSEWTQVQKDANAAIECAREQKRQYNNTCEYLSLLRKAPSPNTDEIAEQLKHLQGISTKYREALQKIVDNREKMKNLISRSIVTAQKHILHAKL